MKVIDGSLKNIPVRISRRPNGCGSYFFISTNDPNPKLPDPEVLTRRVSFYFDEEVNDSSANSTADYQAWMAPKTFQNHAERGKS
jgi:hypothetical protein